MRFALSLVTLVFATPVFAQRPLSGYWETDGYGQVFEFTADSIKALEITKLSCVANEAYPARPTPPGALAAFGVPGTPIVFTILPHGMDRARVHLGFSASDMILQRLPRKPAICDTPTPNTILSNFDVFAQNWSDHYPFFAEKGVDWPALVATNRAKLTDASTPQELFAVMAQMILPLRDAHTGIAASSIGRSVRPVRQTPSFVPATERQAAYALAYKHLAGPTKWFCEGNLEFGMIGTDIGYLRIRTFSRYSKEGSFQADTAGLEAALDTVFAGARAWKGMVIDVRLNTGGADPLGIIIANRLATAPYVAFGKQARNDPNDATKWTPLQSSTVTPSKRVGFNGPVVELIGVQSVSAAETFTQALLKRTPPVTRVGENTQGVFSDVMERKLPNGWTIVLPNERFLTDGKSYDIVGIAADVVVESLSPQARAMGSDAAILKAIEILRKQ